MRYLQRMAPLKQKGDLAEMMVTADLLRRGHKIAFPYGEDWDYDLILCRAGNLERVQVKHSRSDGRVIVVRCRSFSLTSGKVRQVKKYTAQDIDWIAVWDPTTRCCYYVPSSQFADGRSALHLRLQPARSGRRQGIRDASDYLEL